MSRDARGPGCDGDEGGHHANEGGLAGAIRSQQAEDFLVPDKERNIVYCGKVPVLLGNVSDFYGVGSRVGSGLLCSIRQCFSSATARLDAPLSCAGDTSTSAV